MFQYVWYDKTKDIHKDNIVKLPKEFINFDDIEKMSLIYWSEHCTECAVPLCYNNCINWESRIDKKCRKFVYGIRKTKTNTSYNATLKLKRWGKIESLYFKRAATVKKIKKLDKFNNNFSKFTKGISKVLRFLSPTMKLSGLLEHLKNKCYKKIGAKESLNQFLVSAYLHNEEKISLFFEISAPGRILDRKSISLQPGYNQILFDINKDIFEDTENIRVRIFGSEDIESEITFFFLDFVKLNKKGEEKLVFQSSEPAKKVKCVVWDLDNTMWDGILIESDPEKLELKPNILETIRWLDERGIIQCIASKNHIQEADKVLKRLNIENYFVYKYINWSPKSINIKDMAKQLNINVNTFAFVDDSPYERVEVQDAIPCIRVYKETQINDFCKMEEFDVPITEDSKRRREMYLVNKERTDYKIDQGLDNIEFLHQCEQKGEFHKIDTEDREKRSYELLLRTNQLNLSGKKYSENEFKGVLEKNDYNNYAFYLRDKFGPYGQSLFVSCSVKEEMIIVNEFAMSCRIAGKHAESAVMNWIYEKHGKKDMYLIGKNNKKNSLLIDVLLQIGFVRLSDDESDELILCHQKGKPYVNCDIVEIIDKT